MLGVERTLALIKMVGIVFYFSFFVDFYVTTAITEAMPISDKVKVTIVAMGYLFCLGTMWISPSIVFGDGSMRVLTPDTRQFCKVPNAASKQCQKDCQSLQSAANKCDYVVQQAYRHINLGGCAMDIKAWTHCETEWCQGGMDRATCLSECAGVRDALETCKVRVIQSFFQRYSLEKDGTMKVS